MNQVLLKIELPAGKELRGSVFRELLAKNTNLPEQFFHYENGRPKNGDKNDLLQISALPPICIVSGKGWVGVLAQPGSENLLKNAAVDAISLVSSHVGETCKAEIQLPGLDCKTQKIPSTYWIREMVLKRRSASARAEGIESLVEQRIKAGLVRYAAAYGIVLPSWADIDLKIMQCARPRGLALQTTSGVTKEFVTLVDVEFEASIDLQGVWMIGNLTARGYGRVSRSKNVSLFAASVVK
jgi:hypothetical protein